MNLFLFLLSFFLVAIFTPLGFIGAFVSSVINWNKGILNDYFFKMAISLDQFGNVALQKTFNFILIKRNAKDKFGNPDETISSVLGKNQKKATLSYLGRRLVALLDAIEKDHSLKSIEK